MRECILFLCVACLFSFLCPPDSKADVYHLKNGSVRAGTTLSSVGSSMIRIATLKGVVEFPRENVQSVESTADSNGKLKRLQSRLDLQKPRCVAVLARWCRLQGLFEKMFDFYDMLVTLDPENTEMRAFVLEMSSKIQYQCFDGRVQLDEDGCYKILKALSRSGPTLKSIGEFIIFSQPDDIVESVFSRGLNSPVKSVQFLSIELLSRQTPALAIKPLIGLSLLSSRENVRDAAGKALLNYKHDGIIYPYLKALKSKIRSLRLNAMQALALFNDKRAVAALISNLGAAQKGVGSGSHRGHIHVGKVTSAVTGFDANVANSAAIAKPLISLIQDGALLDVNVLGSVHYNYISKDEQAMIAGLLSRITGLDYGDDYVLWKGWWDKNKEQIADR